MIFIIFKLIYETKPYPRGEILAHTSRTTPGYFNDEKSTKEMFTKIGDLTFFRTGDIGELVDGKIRVIDRISSLFKLMQGKEYMLKKKNK